MATTVGYICTASDSFKPIKFLQSDWLYEVFTRDRFYPIIIIIITSNDDPKPSTVISDQSPSG